MREEEMIVNERLVTYIDSISWSLPDDLKEVEREALANEVPIIRRSMQTLLGFLIRLKQPETVLEIGTAVGFSGMLMSEYVAPGVVIDTIEKVPARIRKAKENFRRFHREDRIHLMEGEAGQILERLASEGRKYDFIFMDAAKGQYQHFLHSVLTLLAEDGMLVTDNVLQEGDIIQSRYAVTRRDRTIHGRMREFLYALTHSDRLDTVVLPVGDGAAVTRLKSRRVAGQNGE